jgi:DNA-directed RNA polymerase, mitochondrial
MSWVTPLGLPVTQPYRSNRSFNVKTAMRSVILAVENDDLPVAATKQRSAFPPNFVHSLDATHMILTSLKMKKLGLEFAAVHDSYWTHAADVDSMRQVRFHHYSYGFISNFVVIRHYVKVLLNYINNQF